MKVLTMIFVLLPIAEIAAMMGLGSWLTPRRAQSEIRTDDIVRIMEKTKSFRDLYSQLNESYRARGDFKMAAERFKHNAHDVADFLRNMDLTFMMASLLYFVQHVVEYYTITGRLATDLIGLTGGQGSCMLMAFHDRSIIVHTEFENMLFQLLLNPSATRVFPPEGQIRQLNAYREKYKNFLAMQTGYAQMPGSPITPRFARSENRIRDVVRVLINFPVAFCSRWRPLVDNYLFAKNPPLDCRNRKNVFVCHVIENETCEAHLELPDPTWKCDNILTSEEYGLKKYEEDFTKIKIGETQGPREDTAENRGVKFRNSLADLRKRFNENPANCKNAVTFYNIASDVMLLVSIREGWKVFSGIKHVVTRDCGARKVSVDEILGLRLTLYSFRLLFDRLVVAIRNRKRIDVTQNPHKKKFKIQLSLLLRLLDVRDERTDDGKSIAEMCSQVPKILEEEKFNASVGDNAYADVKVREFYLTLPILRVDQLYWFYTRD